MPALRYWISKDGEYLSIADGRPENRSLTSSERFLIESMGRALVIEIPEKRLLNVVVCVNRMTAPLRRTLVRNFEYLTSPDHWITLHDSSSGAVVLDSSIDAAIDKIQMMGLGASPPVQAFVSRAFDPKRVFDRNQTDTARRFGPLIEAWQERSELRRQGVINTELPIFSALAGTGLLGRSSLVEPDKDGALRFGFFGAALDFVSDTHRQGLIGARVTDQPDANLGAWIDQEFRACLDHDEPRIFACSGIIVDSDGRPARRDWYRLVLPVHMAHDRNSVGLLGTTLPSAPDARLAA